MAFNHRIGGLVFAFGVGLLVAFLSYQWITDPAPRLERQLQEATVMAAREQLLQARCRLLKSCYSMLSISFAFASLAFFM